jgi:mRNA degradation ribonuclease J1/J2
MERGMHNSEYKAFGTLTTKKKFQLKKLYKRQSNGEKLEDEEQLLAEHYREDWQAALTEQKSKRPVIIFLIVCALLAVFFGPR